MTDLISRADAIEAVRKELVCDGRHETHDKTCRFIADVLLSALPSSDAVSRETALERVKEARHLLTLVEEEAKQHEDDYDFLWGIIQEAVYCQGVINTIVWRCNRINNPGLQKPIEIERIVRCKDCRHQRFYINDKESFCCDKSGVVNMHMEEGDGEFFCSYGERR